MNGKFRVWDKEKKEWCSSVFYLAENGDLYQHIVTNTPYHSYHTLDPIDKKRYIKQFFIGRQDKNGKDIYEGDILYTFGHFYKIVEYENGTYMHSQNDYLGTYYSGFTISSPSEVEIIGNIMENPELLEEPK